MTEHDDFERLARMDPAASVPVHPVNGPRAAALMEQIMQTTTPDPVTPERRRRRSSSARWLGIGGLGVAAVAAVAFIALRSDDAAAPTSVTFSLAASDPLTSMCLALDQQQPSATASAFRGTVVAVDADSVTLDVTKWYANGTADQVVVSTAGMPSPALDGVTFEMGGDYLVMAGDGQVGTCGVSGPYSPELEGFYQGWFGA